MRNTRRFGSPRMRLLDLGTVPWARSQSVHHAVARCFDEQTPDTLVIVRPDAPYLCVGRHRVGAPLSPSALRRGGLPVVRRGLGGGTVLVTPDQTFFVFVLHRSRLPLPDPEAFAWCLRAGAAAYRRLGVAAEPGAATDLSAQGRKLCGSGAATIGEAAVFGGNVIHDFDPAPFAAALHLPSATVRRVVHRELDAQMGSVRALVGSLPAPDTVRAALRDGTEEACGVRLVPGALSAAETAAIPEVERWITRVPPDLLRPDGRPPYWKVRAGAGVLRLTVPSPRRTVVLAVRERRVVEVVGEAGGRSLAARLAPVVQGHGIDDPVDASTLRTAGLDDATAGALTDLLSRAATWVT